MQKISVSLRRTNIIKGLAILAVIFVHVLAYFPGIYQSQKQIIFISIDQLARFCMPAFIMLSGYGLAFKYEQKEIHYFAFLKNRIWKLLPLYLLWSFYSILIIKAVPAWSFGNQPMSLIIQILFGQADYQLYFLPVIFQLYALFPLIWLLRKRPNLMLILAILAQAITYYIFSFEVTNSDRFQYVWFLSWIAYFVFGIYLKLATIPKIIIKMVWPLTIIAFMVMAFSSLHQINSGLDPLPALKFTRLIVIPFGLLINFGLATLKTPFKENKNIFSNLLAWLGKNSYIIFLSHTIGLRIIYTVINNKLGFYPLLAVIFSWLMAIFFSQKFLLAKKTKTVINR